MRKELSLSRALCFSDFLRRVSSFKRLGNCKERRNCAARGEASGPAQQIPVPPWPRAELNWTGGEYSETALLFELLFSFVGTHPFLTEFSGAVHGGLIGSNGHVAIHKSSSGPQGRDKIMNQTQGRDVIMIPLATWKPWAGPFPSPRGPRPPALQHHGSLNAGRFDPSGQAGMSQATHAEMVLEMGNGERRRWQLTTR
mmetsp:Transcript_16166/g.43886  ORF Transcript_16166/g.43886 Transcript_16166/m.43886 type:complete len:198 (+) Transcript_16166:876-1469(+)